MGVVPVSFHETAIALKSLRLCPISLWADLDSEQPAGHGNMWTVSLLGRSPRELRSDSHGWSVLPDESLMAFSPYGRFGELWLMNSQDLSEFSLSPRGSVEVLVR